MVLLSFKDILWPACAAQSHFIHSLYLFLKILWYVRCHDDIVFKEYICGEVSNQFQLQAFKSFVKPKTENLYLALELWDFTWKTRTFQNC